MRVHGAASPLAQYPPGHSAEKRSPLWNVCNNNESGVD